MSLIRSSRNPQEYAALEDLYSPIIHRVNQAVRERAVDPEKKVEDILQAAPEVLTKYSEPPKELVAEAKTQIEALTKIADVKPGMFRKFGRVCMCAY